MSYYAKGRTKAKHGDHNCPTGKRRYRDHDEAIKALRKITPKYEQATIPVRTYECDRCNGHHLTSWKEYRHPDATR